MLPVMPMPAMPVPLVARAIWGVAGGAGAGVAVLAGGAGVPDALRFIPTCGDPGVAGTGAGAIGVNPDPAGVEGCDGDVFACCCCCCCCCWACCCCCCCC
ncbi:hypothetical protein C8Q79DRAFT_977073, partial [Trametes meyenii]